MVEALEQTYISTTDAARILGAAAKTVNRLVREGKVEGRVKIANRWLVPRAAVEKMAKAYVPKVGAQRRKRKYTKRSPIWFKQQG